MWLRKLAVPELSDCFWGQCWPNTIYLFFISHSLYQLIFPGGRAACGSHFHPDSPVLTIENPGQFELRFSWENVSPPFSDENFASYLFSRKISLIGGVLKELSRGIFHHLAGACRGGSPAWSSLSPEGPIKSLKDSARHAASSRKRYQTT